MQNNSISSETFPCAGSEPAEGNIPLDMFFEEFKKCARCMLESCIDNSNDDMTLSKEVVYSNIRNLARNLQFAYRYCLQQCSENGNSNNN